MVSVNRAVQTTRAMPVNHLIRPGDVVDVELAQPVPAGSLTNAESLHGSYVRIAKNAGDTLALPDVNASPILPASAALMSLSLKPSQALGGLLTADMRMDVYGIPKTADGKAIPERLVRDVRVVGVMKDSAVTDGSLVIVIELPPADASGLHEAALKLAGATELSVTVRS